MPVLLVAGAIIAVVLTGGDLFPGWGGLAFACAVVLSLAGAALAEDM